MLITDPEFEPAEGENPIMYKLDVQYVQRNRRQAVVRIGWSATIQLADPNQTLPGIFGIIDQKKTQGCDRSVVISSMPYNPPAIPVAGFIDPMVVCAIEEFF